MWGKTLCVVLSKGQLLVAIRWCSTLRENDTKGDGYCKRQYGHHDEQDTALLLYAPRKCAINGTEEERTKGNKQGL